MGCLDEETGGCPFVVMGADGHEMGVAVLPRGREDPPCLLRLPFFLARLSKGLRPIARTRALRMRWLLRGW